MTGEVVEKDRLELAQRAVKILGEAYGPDHVESVGETSRTWEIPVRGRWVFGNPWESMGIHGNPWES